MSTNYKCILSLSLFLLAVLKIDAQDIQQPLNLPIPVLKQGTAIISGQIKDYNLNRNSKVKVSYSNPIMNKIESSEVKISEDGTFILPVKLLTSSICFFVSDYYKEYILLSPGDTCYIDINGHVISDLSNFDAIKRKNINDKYVNFRGTFADVNNDLFLLKFLSYEVSLFRKTISGQSPEQYKTHILNVLRDALLKIKEDILSKRTIELLTIELNQKAIFTLLYLNPLWDDYALSNSPVPNIDTSYFSFLKELKVNTLYSFYGRHFSSIIQSCISLEELTLSYDDLIKKNSASQKPLSFDDILNQREYLSKILGENSGVLFDMLEMQNYTSKLEFGLPLGDWEMNRLKELSNSFYFEYLNDKNDSLLLQQTLIQKNPRSVLIDATKQENINYFDQILNIHKGKTILVTYWSIGCQFALSAINSINSMSENYHEKDVVFVNITDDHFLTQIWENKANQISGFNYRLRKEQIDYFIEKYSFNSTPSFVIFDNNGECLFSERGLSEPNMKEIISALDKS